MRFLIRLLDQHSHYMLRHCIKPAYFTQGSFQYTHVPEQLSKPIALPTSNKKSSASISLSNAAVYIYQQREILFHFEKLDQALKFCQDGIIMTRSPFRFAWHDDLQLSALTPGIHFVKLGL